MRLHRFIGDFTLRAGTDIVLNDQDLLNQIRNVFRLGVGDRIILCDNDFTEAVCTIKELRKDLARLEIGEIACLADSVKRKVHLFCSIIKNENFDLVVQKATEVGVSEITPLITKRTIKTNLKYDRLNKIIKEAGEQSGRGQLPILHEAATFEQAIKSLQVPKFLFDMGGREFCQTELSSEAIGIFIGPEGGWEDTEIAAAKESGAVIVSMGDLVLRAETAAMVATYLASNN